MKLQYFIIFYQPNFPQGNRTLVADKLKMLYIYIYIPHRPVHSCVTYKCTIKK
jgi:hypothetical protein